MLRFATVVVLLCILSLVSSAPPVKSFKDFDGLKPQTTSDPANSKRFTSSFHHVDWLGRGTHLEYDSELNDGVFSLDTDQTIDSVVCDKSTLTVGFVAPGITPAWSIGEVVVGGPHWGCLNAKGKGGIFLRKIADIQVVDSLHMRLVTTNVTFMQVFRNLNMGFKTNEHSMKGHADASPAATSPSARSLKSFLSEIEGAASSVINGVEDIAQGVYDVASGSFSSNFNPQYETFSWNYAGPGSASGPVSIYSDSNINVNCANCYANVQGTAYMNFVINDWSLQTLTAGLESGSVDLMASGSITVNYQQEFSNQYTLASLGTSDFPTITFYIGPIPVTLDFSVDIIAGYDVNVGVTGSVNAQAQASGSFNSIGIAWNPSTSSFDQVWDQSISTTGTWSYDGSAEVNAILYVAPQLAVEVESVLTFDLLPIPFVDIEFYANTNAGCDLQLSVSAGLQVNFEIQFGLVVDGTTIISQKTWGPWTVFGPSETPFYGTCLISSSSRESSAAPRSTRKLLQSSSPVTLTLPQSATPTCPSSCSGYGHCSVDGKCTCFEGRGGSDCSQVLYAPQPRYSEFKCTTGQCTTVTAADLPTCSATFPASTAQITTSSLCLFDGLQQAVERDALIGTMLDGFKERGPKCYQDAREFLCGTHFPSCVGDADNHISMVNVTLCEAALTECLLPSHLVTAFCKHAALSPDSGLAINPNPQYTRNIINATVNPQGTCQSASSLPSDSLCGSMLPADAHVFVYSSLFNSPTEADQYAMILLNSSLAASTSDADQCSSSGASLICAQFLPQCEPTAPQPAPLGLCQSTCVEAVSSCPSTSASVSVCSSFDQPLTSAYVAPTDAQCSYSKSLVFDVVPEIPIAGGSGASFDVKMFIGIALGVVFATTAASVAVQMQRKKAEAKRELPLVPNAA